MAVGTELFNTLIGGGLVGVSGWLLKLYRDSARQSDAIATLSEQHREFKQDFDAFKEEWAVGHEALRKELISAALELRTTAATVQSLGQNLTATNQATALAMRSLATRQEEHGREIAAQGATLDILKANGIRRREE